MNDVLIPNQDWGVGPEEERIKITIGGRGEAHYRGTADPNRIGWRDQQAQIFLRCCKDKLACQALGINQSEGSLIGGEWLCIQIAALPLVTHELIISSDAPIVR